MKLNFQLTKFNKGLAFQVISQTNIFLNTDISKRIEFKSSTGFKIVSEHLTRFNLDERELHICGAYIDNKSEIATTIFLNNKERDLWYDFILNRLEEWANDCEFFKEENQIKSPKLKKRGYSFEI